MNDAPTDARAKRPTISLTEGVEQLILLSHTLSQAAAGSAALTAAGLTVESYAILVSLGAEDGSPTSKIARRATPAGAAMRQPRTELLKAGLIQEVKQEGDRSFTLTEAGAHKVAAVRADLSGLTSGIDESQVRPLARIANLVRQVSKALAGEKRTKASGPDAKAERAAKKATRREAKAA